jgi:hypothetical protein
MGKPSRKRRNPLRQTAPHGGPTLPTLIPHTNAWFEAMLPIDPVRALITTSVVERAGRLDACSVCGDSPAPIYDDLHAPHVPMRLCEFCLPFRVDVLGEQREPRRSKASEV